MSEQSESNPRAQAGTDILEALTAGQTIVVPFPMIVVAVAATLGTAGTTTSTLTLTKNGSNTTLAPQLTSGQTASPAGGIASGSVSCVPGDVLGMATALGTSAANPGITIWMQRATP